MRYAVLGFLLLFSFSLKAAELLIHTQEKTYTYQTDIADTPFKQQLGLMYQKELPDQYGMTFLFDEKRVLNMWMKNTYIPLDMIFFDEEGIVTHIHKNAEPFSEKLIFSGAPAKGVIEVIAGTADEKKIQIGDRIEVKP